jgi:uncharacterized protein (DUF983 family)
LKVTHSLLLLCLAATLAATFMQIERRSRRVPSQVQQIFFQDLRPIRPPPSTFWRGSATRDPVKGEAAMSETTELPDTDRPSWPAMRRGWSMRCPCCGEGRLLHSYLKVNAACSTCGQELHHHRADDGPAYLTILIAGHLMAPLLMFVYSNWQPEPLPMALSFTFVFVALSLFLLPRLKGVLVAIQWANRMHGFGDDPTGS